MDAQREPEEHLGCALPMAEGRGAKNLGAAKVQRVGLFSAKLTVEESDARSLDALRVQTARLTTALLMEVGDDATIMGAQRLPVASLVYA